MTRITPTPRTTTHAPSKYQQTILDWLTQSTGNALVQARAGSGKTSTLVMLADAMPHTASATFLAFNKAIATELAAKLPPQVSASTFHSLAFRAVGRTLTSHNRGRRCTVDAQKVARLFDDTFTRDYVGVRAAVLKLVSLMKAGALLPDASDDTLIAIMAHYDVEWDDDNFHDHDVCEMARAILKANNDDTRTVDFDDMLYFVVVFNVRLDTFDYIMVDESQDTNEIQRIILRKLLHGNSRLIAVGDEAQAIYGFRGASADSMDLIAQDFDCVRLPLSISYRCPSSVLDLARQYVPDIEARENAPQGTVLYPESWKLADFLADDLVICRNTMPLVSIAYRMIAARIPCKIMGREIGKGLVNLIAKVAGKRTTLDELPTKLLAYRDKEVGSALARKLEGKAQAIQDRCDSILALCESMTPGDRARGINGLTQIIESMFSDNGPQVTTLATVHKSKGMEAQRVFIVDRHLMPSKFARQPWQIQQEHNLAYVAITRSLDTLAFIDSKTVV